ncbi:GGDEF domain-containing protein [Lacticaseibacillus sp. GG6-2]
MATILLQWGVDCLISILALAGYVTYYNQLLSDTAQHPLRIDVMIIAVACGLQLAQWIDPVRFKLYANLQLLVLAFPLLGTDVNRHHLVVRFIGLAVFTALNHPGLGWPQYVAAFVGQAVVVAIMVRWHDLLREHFIANSAIMLILVAGYWLPRADINLISRIGLIVTYLVISGANFWYWLALRHADRRYSQLAHRVDFDPLTDAASYALFRRDAQKAFVHARKQHASLVIMMLDIDYFKRVNDHYGHPVGDAVLVAGLQRLEQVLKSFGARIYRTGGEEFTVILADATLAGAESLAIRCRQAIREAPLVVDDLQIDVTISIGVDALNATDTGIDELYARVDADLYRSKARGRDTITVNQKTLWRHDRLTISHFFAEYTQPIIALADRKPLAFGIDARYWKEKAKDWVQADRNSMSLHETLRFLADVVPLLKATAVQLVLTPEAFVAPATLPRLKSWQADHAQVQTIRVVVAGTPPLAVLAELAPHYRQAGCELLYYPQTSQDSWQAYLPFVDALVIALGDDREHVEAKANAAKIAGLAIYAQQVDNETELARAQAIGATSASGEFFGAPVLPQVAARTNRDQVI